jgi:hypothetical protein
VAKTDTTAAGAGGTAVMGTTERARTAKAVGTAGCTYDWFVPLTTAR